MFFLRHSRVTAPKITAATVATATLALVGCSSEASTSSSQEEETSAPVTTNSAAPEITADNAEREGGFNFVGTTDDGNATVLGNVAVYSKQGWYAVETQEDWHTTLEPGKYQVIARGASGCPGVGNSTDEGLGKVGEIHVADDGAAHTYATPAEVDENYFSTVVLADDADEVVACGRRISWSPPTTESTTETSSSTSSTTDATSS